MFFVRKIDLPKVRHRTDSSERRNGFAGAAAVFYGNLKIEGKEQWIFE
jgi:hypothetical protein